MKKFDRYPTVKLNLYSQYKHSKNNNNNKQKGPSPLFIQRPFCFEAAHIHNNGSCDCTLPSSYPLHYFARIRMLLPRKGEGARGGADGGRLADLRRPAASAGLRGFVSCISHKEARAWARSCLRSKWVKERKMFSLF